MVVGDELTAAGIFALENFFKKTNQNVGVFRFNI